ncbi:MAG: hypothetical protein KBA31_00090 [Alphaproteobacteria bacterium]|nr:hypothetical protein [Alphaproteobacteria bacterium]
MKTPIDRRALPTTISVPGFPPIEVSVEARPSNPCLADSTRECPTPLQPPPGGEVFTFHGRNYQTESAAHDAGRRLLDALLIGGALGKLGIDVGTSKATLSFSQMIHDAVRRDTGRELRADLWGLMVYEKDMVQIVRMQAEGFASTSAQSFASHLEKWRDARSTMTDRQRTCASLLNDSFYVAQADAQFILRISAVEALCDQRDVGEEYAQTIDALLAHLDGMRVDATSRESARRVLARARKDSLRQAYTRKLRQFLDADSVKEFEALYDLRSKYVHDGAGRGEFAVEAGKALEIACRLLEAELRAGASARSA